MTAPRQSRRAGLERAARELNGALEQRHAAAVGAAVQAPFALWGAQALRERPPARPIPPATPQ
jgi:hypothetical protein